MLSALALLCLPALPCLPAAAAGAQPLGAPISLGSEGCRPHDPRLARHPDGGFVAAWTDGRVHLRRWDRFGAAVGPERVLPELPSPFSPSELAVSRNGAVAVTVLSEGLWRLRILDGDLMPIVPPIELDSVRPATNPLVAADGEGGFVAVWSRDEALAVARFDERGEPLGPVADVPFSAAGGFADLVVQPDGDLWLLSPVGQLVTSPPSGVVTVLRIAAGTEDPEMRTEGRTLLRTAALAAGAHGEVALALGTFDITLIRLDDSLEPVAEPILVAERLSVPGEIHQLELTGDAVGNLMAVWAEGPGPLDEPATVYARALTPEGEPAGPVTEVGTGALGFLPLTLAAAPLEAGEAVICWAGSEIISLAPLECEDDPGPQAARAPLGGPRSVLLSDGRFRVEVEWQAPRQGTEGHGRAHPDSADTGSFWFFDPDNLELTVKVLDGRPVNGRFWFFYGALTNVGYRITVTDQLTGRERTYDNPPGRFGSFADTAAFPGADP